MKSINDIVYSKEVIGFTAVSNEYCKFIDGAYDLTGVRILQVVQKLLPLLYLKAVSLPEIESRSEEVPDSFVQEDDWQKIHDTLISKFGEANDYLEISVDDHSTEELESASIAENLADIYQDNMNFLMAYRIGDDDIMYDAVCGCSESFRLYWGRKVVNTIRSVHYALADEEKIGDEQKQASDERDTSSWFISRRQDDMRKENDDV